MFRLVVLPDFQHYNDLRLRLASKLFGMDDQQHVLHAQVQWVAQNAERLGVALVLQEGDLTQSNYQPEWEAASQAMAQLDGVVPYVVCVGNHDMGYEEAPPAGRFWASNRRDSLLSRYFPPERFAADRFPNTAGYQYGGHYGDGSENYFIRFEADSEVFLVLSLEFLPRDEVLQWANSVIAEHSQCRVIVLTHGFIDVRGRRSLRADAYGISGNDAPEVWTKLIARHANIFLVLCGHDYGEARRTDRGVHGNLVHQVLANYQWWPKGGSGWLRMLTFDGGSILFETYSPVLDRFRRSPSSHFLLPAPQRTERRWPCLGYLQRRKLYHFFRVLDADGSGDLQRSDFELIADRFIKHDRVTPRGWASSDYSGGVAFVLAEP